FLGNKVEHEIFSTCSKWPSGIRTLKMDGSESVRLLLKKQHPVKRQPRSATTLKKWRGEESPSVLRRRGCQYLSDRLLASAYWQK
ncbi:MULTISPECIES: hypothetical protein, partial [unclassified Microcystis]|uniref:hypothetical protein n=1 Tax=unclassified Microcystis TaxID=2643300 RepID=UPI0025876122